MKRTFLSLYIVQFFCSINVSIRNKAKNKKSLKERNLKEKNEFRKNVIRSNDLVPSFLQHVLNKNAFTFSGT